jgi:hypothetical protein
MRDFGVLLMNARQDITEHRRHPYPPGRFTASIRVQRCKKLQNGRERFFPAPRTDC